MESSEEHINKTISRNDKCGEGGREACREEPARSALVWKWGWGVLGRRDNLYKGPEAGQLHVLMGRQEASVAGAQ